MNEWKCSGGVWAAINGELMLENSPKMTLQPNKLYVSGGPDLDLEAYSKNRLVFLLELIQFVTEFIKST